MGYGLRQLRLNRTTLLICGCAAFLAGLVLARRVSGMSGWWPFAAMIPTLALLPKRNYAALIMLLAAGVLLGLWRGDVYLNKLAPYRELALRPVTFTASANIDAVYGQNSQLSFVARDVHIISPYDVRLPGAIKVNGFGVTMVYQGDRVAVDGKLYPTRGANQATVSFARIRLMSSGGSTINTVRRKFVAGLQTALPEPLASFGLGLLVGQRNTLPADLTQALLMVGLTHIIAVSGYNLTILLQASRKLLGERSKVVSVVLALVLIFGFLLVAGASASIVRAAVISILGLSAWYYGRTVRPLLLLLLTAAGTTFANPVYLWADISWYLSFLAFFGILLVGPMVTQRLYSARTPPLVIQILIESLCAEIMTLPLVLYIFGQMSLVSLLANVLIVALIPLAMLLSLIAGLAGMFAMSVVGWFAWPARLLLTYMLDVVNLLSNIPHIFQQNRYLSSIDMGLMYAGIAVVLVAHYMRERRAARFGFGIKKIEAEH